MDKKSKEQFPGPNPEMGVGGDAVAEFERRIFAEDLEKVIHNLAHSGMSLADMATVFTSVANQLLREHIEYELLSGIGKDRS